MKVGAVGLAASLVVATLAGSASPASFARERRDPAAPRTARSSEHASRDAAAVRKTIEASAKAFTDFTRTRNIESVLSFYASDFTGIENGQDAGLDSQRELLEDLRQQLIEGANVGLSFKTTNVEVRVVGTFAWATYDYLFRLGSPDGTWDEEEGKCSSVLEKTGSIWLFKHEHCSSICPDEQDDDEPDDAPLQDRT